MKAVLISLGLFFGIVVLVGGFGVANYVSYKNLGVDKETSITTAYTNLQNIKSTYALKVAEAAKVPGMMRDDLVEVTAKSLSARYGSEGSGAVVQWIQENYPGKVEPALYIKIQQIIEGGRDKFQNEQTAFLDLKQGYEKQLGYVWSGFWLDLAGYPKIDLKKFNIIVSGDTKEQFETGIDSEVKLQ